jgi:hypothetical protein
MGIGDKSSPANPHDYADMDIQPQRKPSVLWGLVAAAVAALVFYIIYWFFLKDMKDTDFLSGLYKFLWIWGLNLAISIIIHEAFKVWKHTGYQIANVKEIVFNIISSCLYAIFVIAGVYGWFLGVIPLALSFDQYPWCLLLFTFFILKLVVYAIASSLAMIAAQKVDNKMRDLSDKMGTWGYRFAYGNDYSKSEPKNQKQNRRESVIDTTRKR